MQSHELDGPDLVIRLTWPERMALAAQAQQIQRNLESSFERIFGNEKSRLQADSDGRKE